MEVLLSAYACAPNTGSEYDVGWNWSLQNAKQHETWVLTKSENKEKIERWMETNVLPNTLHFQYIDIPHFATKIRGRLGVLFKYIVWQWIVISKAKELCEEHTFAYVQHLTFATVTLPMFLYRLNLPLVIGPAGGRVFLQLLIFHLLKWISVMNGCVC